MGYPKPKKNSKRVLVVIAIHLPEEHINADVCAIVDKCIRAGDDHFADMADLPVDDLPAAEVIYDWHLEKPKLLADASPAHKILEVYTMVASGHTQGSGGSYYADGKGTLHHVNIPVELLEELAREYGVEVLPRVNQRK